MFLLCHFFNLDHPCWLLTLWLSLLDIPPCMVLAPMQPNLCHMRFLVGCMLVESRPFVVFDGLSGLYGLKYDSVTAYRLLLYLCSYKLDGSATCGRFAVCTLAQSSLAYIFFPFATLKGWRIYPNSPIRWFFSSSCAAYWSLLLHWKYIFGPFS